MEEQTEFEVIIAGAGPAACGLASGLLRAGLTSVALIEKPVSWPFRIGESATPDVPLLLHQLGLPFDPEKHAAYTRNLVAWGSEEVESHDFLFRGKGNGWHLDRQAFDAQLRQAVIDLGVPVFTPDWVQTIEPLYTQTEQIGWKMRLNSGKILRSKIVVDATGRGGALSKRLGIKRVKLDDLIALAVRVPDKGMLPGASFVHSCEVGWWYAVNLNNGYNLVSLMTTISIAKSKELQNAEVFNRFWSEDETLMNYVSPPDELQQPHTFAAYTSCLQQAAGKKWLAVGDALMSFDPLTSSGISGALTDALSAIPVVMAQLQNNYEPARDYAFKANETFKRYLIEREEHDSNELRWK